MALKTTLQRAMGKLVHSGHMIGFWNKCEESVIKALRKMEILENNLDTVQNSRTNNLPICLEKRYRHTIRPRALIRAHRKERRSNLLASRDGEQCTVLAI